MTKAHSVPWTALSIAAIALLAAASASVASPPAPAAAATPPRDWPQWRGPNRDAVSVERGLLEEWRAGGPPVLWRIPAGEGFSSISVRQGRLYTLWDEGDSEFLVSLEAATGKELWRYRVGSRYSSSWGNGPRSTPAVDDGAVYAVSARGDLHAVAPEDGRPLWRHAWESRCPATGIPTNVAHPVFIPPDKIFVSNGYGTATGSAVFRIVRQGEEFATQTVWRSQTMRNVLNSSVLHEDHIYGFDKGILKAIDAATGEERWQARGFERGSLIAADGRLIVLGEQGNLALLEATPSGYREQGTAQILQGRSWTTPTLAGGRLFLRNQSEMVSLDLRRLR